MKFRKRPVVVDAVRWTGDNFEEMRLFTGGKASKCNHMLVIATLEGEMHALPGDWIIRGISGEYYPCKDWIFEETYEPVAAPGGDQVESGHGKEA